MNRRGMALPLALLALMFVLVTAALLLDRAFVLRRSGERQVQAALAGSMAAGSIALRVATWDSTGTALLGVGGAAELGTRTSGRRLWLVDSVVRLGPGLFLLTSSAVGGTWESGSWRRVGQLVQIESTGRATGVVGGWSVLGR